MRALASVNYNVILHIKIPNAIFYCNNVKRNGQKTRTTLAIGTWVENWTINKP